MSADRGADLLVKGLASAGVKRIFTLSGNQIMPVFDACVDAGIELLHVRHEAAAVHMADAWGRLTGEPGVAMVTGGPGHANAVSALYTARMSESPMVFLSGHAPQSQLGQGAFQEMAQSDMAAPVSKAAWTAGSAAGMAQDALKAMALASAGRPGPVHISLPFDLLNERVADAPNLSPAELATAPVPMAAVTAVQRALSNAEKPLVLAGSVLLRELGYAGLAALESALGAPVVGSDSPRGVNDPALGAFAEVLAEADVIVALGRPVDFTLGRGRAPAMSAQAKFVLIDPEPQSLAASRLAISDDGRILGAFEATAIDTAHALLDAGHAPAEISPSSNSWVQQVREAVAYRPAQWGAQTGASDQSLHALDVARAVTQVYGDFGDGALVMDGGEFGQWSQACLSARRRITNGPGGSIGSSLPMAIAARVARPDGPVLAMLGDGTFGFHMAEFDTAVRYGPGLRRNCRQRRMLERGIPNSAQGLWRRATGRL